MIFGTESVDISIPLGGSSDPVVSGVDVGVGVSGTSTTVSAVLSDRSTVVLSATATLVLPGSVCCLLTGRILPSCGRCFPALKYGEQRDVVIAIIVIITPQHIGLGGGLLRRTCFLLVFLINLTVVSSRTFCSRSAVSRVRPFRWAGHTLWLGTNHLQDYTWGLLQFLLSSFGRIFGIICSCKKSVRLQRAIYFSISIEFLGKVDKSLVASLTENPGSVQGLTSAEITEATIQESSPKV